MSTVAFLLILPLVSQGVLGGEYFNTANGVTYYIESLYEYTWFEAYLECSFRSMSLYTLESQVQFDDLYQLLTSDKFSIKPPHLWFGALGVQDKFVWLKTRKPLARHLWRDGNPNNLDGKEHCVHIWHTQKYLNDNNCFNNFGFVCEMDETLTLNGVNATQSGISKNVNIEGKQKGLIMH